MLHSFHPHMNSLGILDAHNTNFLCVILWSIPNAYYRMFNSSIFSVPGVAERIAFSTLDSSTTFFLYNKSNSDMLELMLGNLLGGPAIIFNRFSEKGNFYMLST